MKKNMCFSDKIKIKELGLGTARVTMREKKMKRILSVSIVALLAVSPMIAKAGAVQPQPEYNPTAGEGNATTVVAPYASETINTEDRTGVASAAYVKGAYNAAIRAVNKVASDAASAASTAGDAATSAAAAVATANSAASDASAALTAANSAASDASAALTAANSAASDASDALTAANSAATSAAAAVATANSAASDASAAVAAASAAASAASAAQSTADDALAAASAAQQTANGRATHAGVENTITTATYATSVSTPLFVNWGDPTATASSTVVTATTSATAASYAEPTQG